MARQRGGMGGGPFTYSATDAGGPKGSIKELNIHFVNLSLQRPGLSSTSAAGVKRGLKRRNPLLGSRNSSLLQNTPNSLLCRGPHRPGRARCWFCLVSQFLVPPAKVLNGIG